MNAVYRLSSDELTPDFISLLRATFPNKEIEIIVNEVTDDTEYLTRSPANKSHLDRAIKNIEDHSNLVTLAPEKL